MEDISRAKLIPEAELGRFDDLKKKISDGLHAAAKAAELAAPPDAARPPVAGAGPRGL